MRRKSRWKIFLARWSLLRARRKGLRRKKSKPSWSWLVVAGLKLEVESLKSVLKANENTIKDIQARCADNYVDGYEDMRDQATKKYPDIDFTYFVPPLSSKLTAEVEKAPADHVVLLLAAKTPPASLLKGSSRI
ncbi:unnamed protein product [Ilex paraguariensis]|uniref:Uncharacterized protein n=1 Tax=Ilex paraguariensis TaxID=185542 RepID=A0ABC8QTM2_9AQUA